MELEIVKEKSIVTVVKNKNVFGHIISGLVKLQYTVFELSNTDKNIMTLRWWDGWGYKSPASWSWAARVCKKVNEFPEKLNQIQFLWSKANMKICNCLSFSKKRFPRKSCEICKHQSDVNDVILVSFLLPFEHISHLFQCFYCWLEKVNVSWLSSFEYIRMQKFEETESKLRSSNCNFRITEIWITHNVL